MVSFNCPPGVLYIAQTAPKLAFAPFLVFVTYQYAAHTQSFTLPNYVWIFVYLIATPTMVVIHGVLQHLLEEREIRKLGARRVPRVPTHWPAGFDALLKGVRSFANGYVGDIFGEWMQDFGPILNLRIFWQDTIITTEPDHIKIVLATEFDNFEKGELFRWYVQSVLGTGVFNSDGEMWKFHRAMTRPFFARDRVTDFETFNNHAEVVVSRMKERFAQGEAIDFQDIMSRFTLDSATEFLFGSCVHSLTARLPYAHNSTRKETISTSHSSDKFAAAFSQAQHQIALRARLTSAWPLAEFWSDRTKNSMKVIHEYINPILDDALAKRNPTVEGKDFPGNTVHDRSETLLDHLAEETSDPIILRDEILNIMIAGRDTTMATLTFAIYCLSQHPSVFAILRDEILKEVGSNRRPTFDDVKNCKFLRAVINETLRLYPPVPFDVRHSKKSTVFPSRDGEKPYYIPAGTDVPYSVWLMHRRTDLWGPDATNFDPQRFLDARLHKYLVPNSFIFMPFNAGPRICLGQQFAYNEVSFMLIRLVQAFDTITLDSEAQPPDSRPPSKWKIVPGTQGTEKVWPKMHLTLYAHKGLWLRMREAQTDTVSTDRE
ncbi:cytochrome P450 monooxygenase pc-3 [Ramaria rubella]|nr:cytochrome P450 monooxygenase pc-3 [Ramaria rubella]